MSAKGADHYGKKAKETKLLQIGCDQISKWRNQVPFKSMFDNLEWIN
jgi:hypothetical protein